MRRPVLSCASLAAAVLAEPYPLLFIDTAAILDIIRVPHQLGLPAEIMGAATEAVRQALNTPRTLWIVSSETVLHEYDHNAAMVRKELTARVRDLRLWMMRASTVVAMLNPENRVHAVEFFDTSAFETRVLDLVELFMDTAIFFAGTEACATKAFRRIRADRPRVEGQAGE